MKNWINKITVLFKNPQDQTALGRKKTINDVFKNFYSRECDDFIKEKINDPKARFFTCSGAGKYI